MNEPVGEARIGQWYRHTDKGEEFVVTARDEQAGTIEVQSFDGDLDEIDESTWGILPLELAPAPEDWTGPADLDAGVEDDYSEANMIRSGSSGPLKALAGGPEIWEASERSFGD